MPCVKRKLFAFALLAITVFLPNTAFATTATKSCECFCGTEGKGATDMGSMLNTACQKACVAPAKYVGCYLDSQQYPDRNPKCWSQKDCEAWSGLNGTTPISATWAGKGTMPYECTKNKTSGDETSYCYADDAAYKLNIKVGTTESVNNLPTYINILYAWALPAASLVAVVMMMLGGLQYVLSRGKEKYIAKGKERITNAITGLVLLLSVFVILNLIDPRLTSMNALRIPMIKEVTMLDAASSCERLADYGYEISTNKSPASCGGTGKIANSTNLKEGTLGSWKDGDPCDYMNCLGADVGKSCVRNGQINECVSCRELPNPTASLCASVEQVSGGAVEQIYCDYTANVDGLATGTTCESVGSSIGGEGPLKCVELQQQAAALENGAKKGCSVYEDLYIGFSAQQVGFDSIRVSDSWPIQTENGSKLMERVCNEDYCHIAKSIGASKCAYNTGATSTASNMTAEILDFFGITVNYLTTGYYCHTF